MTATKVRLPQSWSVPLSGRVEEQRFAAGSPEALQVQTMWAELGRDEVTASPQGGRGG